MNRIKNGLNPIVLILFTYVVFTILLNYKAKLALSIPEAEAILAAQSIPSYFAGNMAVHNFFLQQGFLLFPTQAILTSILLNIFPFSLFSLRIVNVCVGALLIALLYYFISKYFSKIHQRTNLIVTLLVSPWINNLVTYHLNTSLTLIFILSALIMLLKNKNGVLKKKLLMISFSSLLLLASLSSIGGLIFLVTFTPLLYFYLNVSKKNLLKSYALFFLITFIPLLTLIKYNQDYLISTLTHSTFVQTIFPSTLAPEINDRQKIDFLSANKQFILPSLVRKFIYNKPTLALNKSIDQFIGIFDFEQFAFPFQSYDEIKLSGLLPKGNLPLVYPWDIVIVVIGFTFFLRKKSKKRLLVITTVCAIAPAMIFLKRDISIFGSLIIIPVYTIEAFGISEIFNIFSKLKSITRRVIIASILIVVAVGISQFFSTFYFHQNSYRTSDIMFFQKISDWLNTNQGKYNSIVVTNRFGPTALMASVYLQLPSKTYWNSFANTDGGEKINLGNLTIENIDFTENSYKSGTVLIGLPGEFVGKGQDLDKRPLPENLTKIGEIAEPDELVWQYGQNLWIVKVK